MITPEETAELERLLAERDAADPMATSHRYASRKLNLFLGERAPALLAAARQAEAKDARIAELEDELAEMTFERNGYRALTDGSSEAFGKQFGEDMKALGAARLVDPSPNAGGDGAG